MRFKKPLLCSWICLFSICVATGCGETETTVDTSTSEITSDAQTPNDVAPHNITPDTATDVTSPVTLPENISVHTTAFDRSAQENYCLSRTSFYIDESNDLWIWGDLIVQQLTGVLLNNLSKLQNEELPQNAIAISSYTPNKSNMLDTTILYPICVAEDISIVSNG